MAVHSSREKNKVKKCPLLDPFSFTPGHNPFLLFPEEHGYLKLSISIFLIKCFTTLLVRVALDIEIDKPKFSEAYHNRNPIAAESRSGRDLFHMIIQGPGPCCHNSSR